MKKILLFFVAVVTAIATFGQIKSNSWTMPTLATDFAIAIPAYSTISVQSNNNVYLVTSYYTTAHDMSDVIADGNYVDLTAGGGAGFWESNAPGLISAITGVTTVQIGSDADNWNGVLQFVSDDGDLINLAIDNSDRLGITGGNVGIGTTTPTEELEVVGTTKTDTLIADVILTDKLGSGSYGGNFATLYSDTLYAPLDTAATMPNGVMVADSATGQMYWIDKDSIVGDNGWTLDTDTTSTDKYVGINTTDPQYELDLIGHAGIDGNVYMDNLNDTLFFGAGSWLETWNTNMIYIYGGGGVYLNSTGTQFKIGAAGITISYGGAAATYHLTSTGLSIGTGVIATEKLTVDGNINTVGGNDTIKNYGTGDYAHFEDVLVDDDLTVSGDAYGFLVTKSYGFTSQGVGAGTYYVAGFYDAPVADANLDQGSLTQTLGTANGCYAAHAFCVAGGAGVTDGSDLVITVSGTSITNAGVRNAADSEVIVADATTAALNTYYETTKKWIGQITYTLSSTAGTAYNFDFNYGFVKAEDFSGKDFTVLGFEIVGSAGATDASFNVTLYKHCTADWNYSAAAFEPTPTEITDLQTIHNTEYSTISGDPFAFKRLLSTAVTGSGSEGVIVRIVTGQNNTVQSSSIHIGIKQTE